LNRRLPAWLLVFGVAGAAFAVLPLVGLLLRAPWGRLGEAASGVGALTALRLSIVVSLVAATFVSMPFVVIAAETGLRSLDPRIEAAAAGLGARPGTVVRRVTLPMLAPHVAAGAVLAWARALGEFGATITFAGSLAGRTQTLPLAAYQARQTDPGGAIAVSLLLVALSLVVLVPLRGRIVGRS
jgi:molybdate transport system permease protein